VNLHGEIANVVLAQVIRVQPGLAGKRAFLRKLDIEGTIRRRKRRRRNVPLLGKLPKLQPDSLLPRSGGGVEDRANNFGRLPGYGLLGQQPDARQADIVHGSGRDGPQPAETAGRKLAGTVPVGFLEVAEDIMVPGPPSNRRAIVSAA